MVLKGVLIFLPIADTSLDVTVVYTHHGIDHVVVELRVHQTRGLDLGVLVARGRPRVGEPPPLGFREHVIQGLVQISLFSY